MAEDSVTSRPVHGFSRLDLHQGDVVSRFHSLLAASLVVALAACSNPTGPERVRVLGTIAFRAQEPRISLQPDGRTVEVRVDTFGDGCREQGETAVVVDGLTATVSPYDYRTATAETSCTDILQTFEHRAVVQFPTSGAAVIRIRGQRTSVESGVDTLVVESVVQVP